MNLAAEPGTYVLVLVCTQAGPRQIGKWGSLSLKPGYYSYIGSAFGSGGIRARVSRHCRRQKRMRWHIDYLSARCSPGFVWISYEAERLEHHWAVSFGQMTGVLAVKGFGCSDCKCNSHLFYTAGEPSADMFRELVGSTFFECTADCFEQTRYRDINGNCPSWRQH